VSTTRHFVNVGTRQVHYRRAGIGAPVVLLHASPSSSWALTTFVEVFGRDYAAIALDSPGYGLSDPLTTQTPEIGDYAEALAETLDALGIEQCALFGSHTGATVAIEFARRYPARVSVAMFDGYPAWPDHERANMLREYLPPWEPVWTGLHLVEFFLRYREMSIYWPWYDKRKATRAVAGGRNIEMTHKIALAGFIAGAGYSKGYAAVFRYPEIEAVQGLSVPTCFAGRAEDSLIEALALLGDLPASCWQETLPADDRDAALRYREIIAAHPPRRVAPPPPDTEPLADRMTCRFVPWSGGEILVRECGSGAAPPLVLVPHIPGSSASYEALMLALAGERRVIAIDPPGNGDSDLDRALSIDEHAAAIDEVLDALGLETVDLYGHNGGATIAAALATRRTKPVGRLILDGAMALPAAVRDALAPAYAPDIHLESDGSHLLKLWAALRNEQLYWPWYNESVESVRFVEPDTDPAHLTQRLIGILKQHRNYAATYGVLFTDDLATRFGATDCPTLVCASESDPFASFRERAAGYVTGAVSAVVPLAPVDRALALRAFLDG
jgi:pimeloyl-ACP methyl ester carboxylesterase